MSDAVRRGVEPVRWIPGDSDRGEPEEGIALCLSGGGYRAMLFHVGALWRLHELGILRTVKRISSVSGGSITAGLLGLNWSKIAQDQDSDRFSKAIVQPIRELAATTIDWKAVLKGLLSSGSVADRIVNAYRAKLFKDATLQELPDTPRFVINATNVQSGVLWRFSKPYCWDYRVGKIENPGIKLATAVAASSAFPPFLSPLNLKFSEAEYVPGTGLDLQKKPFTTDVTLTDGGVYDNLGLETAWKRYKTVLVSDGGGQMHAEEHPKHDWGRHAFRVLDLIDNQVRSLRKHQLIESYETGQRTGAYWGIRSDIGNYKAPATLTCERQSTLELADENTRLSALDDDRQRRLINWGYAICDAAVRAHVDPQAPAPRAFPYAGGV